MEDRFFIFYVWLAYSIIGVICSIIFYACMCFVYKRYFKTQSFATFDEFVESEGINFISFYIIVAWAPMLCMGICYLLLFVPIRYVTKYIKKTIRSIFNV